MRSCDLSAGVTQMTMALRRLQERWAEAGEQWRDQTAHDFAEEHLAPLTPQMQHALAAVNRLAAILGEAERDCDDPDRAS